MAGTLNKVMLIGNLGKDPEVRNSDNGGMLVRFPIATTENYTDREGNRRENTEWHTIVVRSPRLGEVCERYLKKGDKVFIEGKIRSRQWTDDHNQTRYNIEIAADSMTMLGPNPMRSSRDEGAAAGTPRAAYRHADEDSDYGSDSHVDQGDDDFPF
ncbi:MAG: single-stranded DNA-binding protein [Schleiferiaceae bacterium]